jgi:hypothetical protein
MQMLKTISMVTISAADLAAVEIAYCNFLNYRIAQRGKISAALAESWGAKQTAGRDFLVLQPESGEPVYLRFIAAEPLTGYAALKTFGWNATEILVSDTDALAEKLSNSPFQIIGPPRELSSGSSIRAMQVIGPAGELLYLTRIPPDKSAFGLESAKTAVDRVFIVVVGGNNLSALREFYADKFRLTISPPAPYRISVLSNAHGLDPEQLHPLSVARLSSRFLIELDQYPPTATVRPCRSGELPPGVSIVSFTVDSLDDVPSNFIQPSANINHPPYNGRKIAVAVGPAGELVELIESPQNQHCHK